MSKKVKVEVKMSYGGAVYSDVVYVDPRQFNTAAEFCVTVTGELDKVFSPRPLWDLIVEKDDWIGEGVA